MVTVQDRDKALLAFLAQFACLYCYGADYTVDDKDKVTPEGIRLFFDFVTIGPMGIKPKARAPGTKTGVKTKQIPRKLRPLLDQFKEDA